MRVAIDTSVLVSAVLFEQSVPRSALTHTMLVHTPLVSDELVREYERVMLRPKLDMYTPRGTRLALLQAYIRGPSTSKFPARCISAVTREMTWSLKLRLEDVPMLS